MSFKISSLATAQNAKSIILCYLNLPIHPPLQSGWCLPSLITLLTIVLLLSFPCYLGNLQSVSATQFARPYTKCKCSPPCKNQKGKKAFPFLLWSLSKPVTVILKKKLMSWSLRGGASTDPLRTLVCSTTSKSPSASPGGSSSCWAVGEWGEGAEGGWSLVQDGREAVGDRTTGEAMFSDSHVFSIIPTDYTYKTQIKIQN